MSLAIIWTWYWDQIFSKAIETGYVVIDALSTRTQIMTDLHSLEDIEVNQHLAYCLV